ncbi:hypothetical protein JKP88DRAFT_261683 [Tribonema minus]|uniref:Uncharacterized protein n=1 Tax=Tribonema minus TaxID=303371 RepID=A0A835YJF1_9STRA|nr:hypothetical protein JKP88DRAFT_261683 [Tribonema minus]
MPDDDDIFTRRERAKAIQRAYRARVKDRDKPPVYDAARARHKAQSAASKKRRRAVERREKDIMAHVDLRGHPGALETVARQQLEPGFMFPVATVALAAAAVTLGQEHTTLPAPQLAYNATTQAWEYTIGGGTALAMSPALPQLAELQEGWRMGAHVTAGDADRVNCELVPAPYYKPGDMRLCIRAGTAFVGAYVVITRPVSAGEALAAATQGDGAASSALVAQGAGSASSALVAATQGAGTADSVLGAATQGDGTASSSLGAATQGDGTASCSLEATTPGAGTANIALVATTPGAGTASSALVAATQGDGTASSSQQSNICFATIASAPSDAVMGVLRMLVSDYCHAPRPPEHPPQLMAYTL